MFYVIRSTFAVKPMFYTGDEDRWTADPHHAARFEGLRVCEEALRESARFARVDVLTLKFQTIYDAEDDVRVFNDRAQSKVQIYYRGFRLEFTRDDMVAMLRDTGIDNQADVVLNLLNTADQIAERQTRVR